MRCKFIKNKRQADNKYVYKCKICGYEIFSLVELKIEKILNLCFNCKHRSQESTRKETCSTCSGNIQIKVFPCSIYGECCLSDKLPQIKNCNTCEDFEAKKDFEK